MTVMHDLLTQHGALPGAEVTNQQEQQAESATKDETDETAAELAAVSLADEETLSIPSIRPVTPSRRSFVEDPVFDSSHHDYTTTSQHPSRIPTPATPPPASDEVVRQGPGILKKMFSMMRKKPALQPQDSILSSVMGFYAAQMTLLAAAVIGNEHLHIVALTFWRGK